MSCSAGVVVVAAPSAPDGGAALARHGADRLHQLEQRWSRFRPTSEISGLNNARGEPRRAHPDTVRLVEALIQAWHATDGSFDPTLLGALVELGYAASRDDATVRTSLDGCARRRGHPDRVLVDRVAGVVQLPAGTTLDPGGLGKGLAADLILAELLELGAEGALVEVGGDIRVGGVPPDGAWTISIAPTGPTDGRHASRALRIADGGIATSSSRLRIWRQDGGPHHHLLDPRTLRSTTCEVVSCTVVAGTAAWAEAFTKVAFVDGLERALAQFEHRGLAASVTTVDGTHHTTTTWTEFCR